MRYILALLFLYSGIVNSFPHYYRIVGTMAQESIDAGIPTPPTFSFIVAYEPEDSYGLVLSHDVFPQTDTVSWEISQPIVTSSFTSEAGDVVSIDGAVGLYDTYDINGNPIRGFYDVTIMGYNLLITEAPVATLTAKVKPMANVAILAKQVAKKMRQIKHAH